MSHPVSLITPYFLSVSSSFPSCLLKSARLKSLSSASIIVNHISTPVFISSIKDGKVTCIQTQVTHIRPRKSTSDGIPQQVKVSLVTAQKNQVCHHMQLRHASFFWENSTQLCNSCPDGAYIGSLNTHGFSVRSVGIKVYCILLLNISFCLSPFFVLYSHLFLLSHVLFFPLFPCFVALCPPVTPFSPPSPGCRSPGFSFSTSVSPEEQEGQLSAEEEEAKRIAEMGKPILGEHSRLEVVIEESYEFKVTF